MMSRYCWKDDCKEHKRSINCNLLFNQTCSFGQFYCCNNSIYFSHHLIKYYVNTLSVQACKKNLSSQVNFLMLTNYYPKAS